MSSATELTLHDNVHELVELESSDALVVSCYLDLRQTAPNDWRGVLIDRFSLLRRTLSASAWQHVRQSFDRIRAYLSSERDPKKRGVAIFARDGSKPFFLARQFDTPMPNFISVEDNPNVYHLVEMKETFHRYIVAVVQKDWARVIEVNMGAAAIESLEEHPEMRERIAQELTHSHYARHGNFESGPYLLEIAESLEHLVLTDGHKHLLLAGDPDCVARLEDILPAEVTGNVLETLHIDEGERPDIVSETIYHFVQHLEDSSAALIDVFRESFYRDELAITGVDKTLNALERGQVDTLLLSVNVQPAVSWKCYDCGTYVASKAEPHRCGACGSIAFTEKDTLGEMTRLGEMTEARIEIVRNSGLLDRVGGVGAMLRWV
ncbi:hypothetical protein OAU50_01710 [Planctomycetota bacterium]|nr:hypothetical protein [Planctomycetota bacterium]